MSRNRLDVAVVESQPLMRQGLVAALRGDPRLRVSLDESDSAALDRGGAVFDILVLDLAAVATDRQVRAVIGRSSVVVHTGTRRWDRWVGVWLCGARGVVDRRVSGLTMVDVVWDASHDPLWVGPQLAVALGLAIKELDLAVDARTPRLLELFAGGRRSATACDELGLSGADHKALLTELRDACDRTWLPTVDLCDGPPAPDRLFSPEPRPTKQPVEALELSNRVLEVMRLIAAGRTQAEIATELFISPNTVKNHTVSALTKFGITANTADNRLWLALYLTGSHRDPDAARRRFDQMVAGSPDSHQIRAAD